MKIAFLGLGHMGAPMADNLIKAGHTLSVFDIVTANVAKLAAAGADAATSPRECATDAEVVITMLPSSSHVKDVYLKSDGVLAGIGKGSVLIDCSTIDPHTTRELAALCTARGNPMADAPVSGGTSGALD